MSKVESIAKKLDKYIINNEIRLNDPDEDEYGQCVASFPLSAAIGSDAVGKLTVSDMWDLCGIMSDREVSYRNRYYGHLFAIGLKMSDSSQYDLDVEIWDGYC